MAQDICVGMSQPRGGKQMALIYVVEDDRSIQEIETFALTGAGFHGPISAGQRIPLSVSHHCRAEVLIVLPPHILQIGVGIIFVFADLQQTDGNIGTMIGDALQIGGDIGQDKSQLYGTISFSETPYMALPDLQDQGVNDLLQRFHPAGQFQIILHETPGQLSGQDRFPGPV